MGNAWGRPKKLSQEQKGPPTRRKWGVRHTNPTKPDLRMSYVEDYFYVELRRGPMPRNAESPCCAKQRIHAALRKALHGLAGPYSKFYH